MTPGQRWQFYIDRGGTFTDIVAQTPQGQIIVHKLLSDNPEQYQDAPIQGIRKLMGIAADEPIPIEQIEVVKMGTTVATNALLERKGDRLVLLITKGFKDALRIGYQNRPDIFAREIVLPSMLYESVVEIDARYDAQGNELKPIDRQQVKQDLQVVHETGIKCCAIVLMHGYRYRKHELQVAEIAREVGFTQISISHEISPLIKLVSRGDTTVVDAYLTPILRRYIDRLIQQLPDTQLMFMKSDGGLVSAVDFQGKDSILSGPAGGIVGAVKTSQRAGFQRIITFDMGGTSTDVAHYAGAYERELDSEIAGARMRVPVLAIHTIAAGGGSILTFDGASYRVGPESGGSNPGPACYRRGGALTVTDANVMLGKIQPQYFPAVFGQDANQPLEREIVLTKFAELTKIINTATDDNLTPEQVASGFMAIAVANMANAIKKISLQKGYDVTRYVLCCFGGAGAQVACLVADNLSISKIFIHPYAGVLSAYGIGLADISTTKVESVERPLTLEIMPELEFLLASLSDIDLAGDIQVIKQVNLKYTGTNSTLTVNFNRELAIMEQDFATEHQTRYGFIQSDKELVIESISVELVQTMDALEEAIISRTRPINQSAIAIESVQMFAFDSWHNTQIYRREDLQPQDCIKGAAIIVEPISTIVIEPNWQATVSDRNYLILERI
ncbi:MAG: hydantoinase/oxoprolinase family protein [Pleurocapsa sp. SU_5_0]|nr:hydantoinase/oxoprolinase family protein [Pleurocapsa sp. SU_5_0]NJR46313.1 hydantoinase/oxoprolinase family protein [Hyellaceae cyanobacterium CSU_1_1]